jgi:uncharacterized membrane protein YheB (UPF0754 family)
MIKKVFITAATVNEVFQLANQDQRFEEVLQKYFQSKSERDEFRQHLWLQILTADKNKVLDAWNERWFIFYYVAICNNQVKSYSSSWHKQFRSDHDEVEIYENTFEDKCYETKDYELGREIINEALEHYIKQDPKFRLTADIFKQKMDGKSCRNIKIYHQGKLLNKDRINREINTAIHSIRHYIKKYGKSIDSDN